MALLDFCDHLRVEIALAGQQRQGGDFDAGFIRFEVATQFFAGI